MTDCLTARWMGAEAAQAVSPGQLARHLIACRPCATRLGRALEDPSPAHRLSSAGPDSSLSETVLTIALDNGTRSAALFLYELARSALHLSDEYRTHLQPTDPVHDWRTVHAGLLTVIARDPASPLTSRPLPPPRIGLADVERVADQALDLAQVLKPGWAWIEFERAHVRLFAGDLSWVKRVFTHLAESSDRQLGFWSCRTLLEMLWDAGDYIELAQAVERYLPNDMGGRYYRLWSVAASGGWEALRTEYKAFCSESLGDDPPRQKGYWQDTLRRNAAALACLIGKDRNAVLALIEAGGREG